MTRVMISGSIPPRIKIRELDSRLGSYPTNVRTGDPTRSGIISSSFDDTQTIVFQQSSNVNYPIVLPNGAKQQFLNDFTSSLGTTTGFVRKGVSDDWSNLEDKLASLEQNLGPYNDSRIELIRNSSFYASGTSELTYPGFSSNLFSKISFTVDVSNTEERIVGRVPSCRVRTGDEFEGQGDITGFNYYNFNTKRWDQIGNKDPATGGPLKYDYAWHSRSLIEPATNLPASGSDLYPSQFSPCLYWYLVLEDPLNSWGYPRFSNEEERYQNFIKFLPGSSGWKTTASPTVMNAAPFATKYHATSSNCLNLRNYISHPFVLEKVHLKIPIIAQRVNVADGWNKSKVGEDYVFFLYRQARSSDIFDTSQDVSSSNRYLIASASAFFYNSASFGVNFRPEDAKPYHTPSFSYNFGLPYKHSSPWDSDFSQVTGSFTGTIDLYMKPAVGNKGFFNFSSLYADEDDPAGVDKYAHTALVQHYWPGGTNYQPFFDVEDPEKGFRFTGKKGIRAVLSGQRLPYGGRKVFGIEGMRDYIGLVQEERLQIEKADGRTLASSLGETTIPFTGTPLIPGIEIHYESSPNRETPYILMPDDELILGVDAVISRPHSQSFGLSGGIPIARDYGLPVYESPFSSMTGSFIKLLTGQAQITFFGSLIKENKEMFSSLNQPLTSDAIHEVVFGKDCLDCYEVEDPLNLKGSYIDYVVTGSFYGSRQVAGSRFQGLDEITNDFGRPPQAPGLIRGVQVIDGSEKFYDSFPPDIEGIWNVDKKIAGRDVVGDEFVIIGGTNSTSFSGSRAESVANSDWVYRFPFESRYESVKRFLRSGYMKMSGTSQTLDIAETNVKGAGIFSSGSISKLSVVTSDKSSAYGSSVSTINKFIFGVGSGISGTVELISENSSLGNVYNAAVGDVRGWKYGLINANGFSPRVIFSSENFGQFRSLLEQRQDSKMVNSLGEVMSSPINIRFMTGSDNLNSMFIDQSSNLSFEATSSLPYFEDQVRNRTYGVGETIEVI